MTVSECVEIEIEANQLAEIVLGKREAVIVDCRCFSDYNLLHVKSAVNAFYSKLMRKRIEANKVDSTCLLGQILGSRPIVPTMMDLVLYADSEQDNLSHQLPQPARICHKRRFAEQGNSPGESSAKVIRLLREKLENTNVFNNILMLKGGFNSFRNHYPELCESSALEPPQTQGVLGGGGMSNSSFNPSACSISSRVSHSQPCLQKENVGPTEILPFLYLGSQQDALSRETLKKYNITYVLNLSLSCPKSDFLESDDHFMRIPVNDSYQEKLLPYFIKAFEFVERARENGAVALIHCLAGISRSPTLAISYVMRHMKMGSDEAFRFVKSKRHSVCPNFNFMGQLLEYEGILRDEGVLPNRIEQNTPSFLDKQDFCPAKVPKSCSAMSLFSSLPSSFSTCSSTEESLPPNQHGKRGMGPAQSGFPERPGALEGSAIASNPSRPVALGFKSRKPIVMPAFLAEELPSPSSELSKLSFSGGLSHVPSIVNPCFIAENNVQPMAPSMATCGSVENPIFGKMVPSIPPKMGTCRSLASSQPFAAQKEIEILSRSGDFDRSFHSSPPKSEPMQIPQEKKEIKESPRSRFPLNLFAFFRKPDHSSEKISRSQTASADLSTYANRPDNLAEAGVARKKETLSPPETSKICDLTETNSPESGFQEGYKTSPEDRDPDRTSIGSTSSHEIAVQ